MADLKLGGLGECPCESQGGDLRVPKVPAAPKKPRKPRSKGGGSHCVISHKGKTVHCYADKSVAERVAAAFTAQGRAGTSFHVGKRK